MALNVNENLCFGFRIGETNAPLAVEHLVVRVVPVHPGDGVAFRDRRRLRAEPGAVDLDRLVRWTPRPPAPRTQGPREPPTRGTACASDTCLSLILGDVRLSCPNDSTIEAPDHSVLLTAIMSLHRPHSRALIAGGTGRVGHAIAERLRADGWTVIAAGRADGDLRTPEGAAGLVTRAVDELGGLDLVVHAAGAGFAPKPVGDVTEADWDDALDVTAKGTFFLAQAAGPGAARSPTACSSSSRTSRRSSRGSRSARTARPRRRRRC